MAPDAIAGAPITFVIDGALEQQTGGYLYDRIIIQGLRDRGAGVRVISLDASSIPANARSALRFAAILDRMREGGHVIVDELCHPRVVAGALLAGLRQRRAGKLITLVHHLGASEREGLAARARLLVERALLRASDGVIVTSETTRSAVIAAGARPSGIRVVLPGRDRLGAGTAERTRGAPGALRLLFVGALTPRKDPLGLLEAVTRLGNVTLTLAGPVDRDPPYAARFFRAAAGQSSRVRVLGEVSDEELARLYGEHDVLVLPSRYEGFGIVLAEAMNHGLAIVATRAGAIPETMGGGGAGILVDPGDPQALERTLRDLAIAPERVRSMQERARARAFELPTWADTQRQFADAVRGLDDGRSGLAAGPGKS